MDLSVSLVYPCETSQADVLNSPLVLVARTDAEAATMIDSNIDPRLGCFSPWRIGAFTKKYDGWLVVWNIFYFPIYWE